MHRGGATEREGEAAKTLWLWGGILSTPHSQGRERDRIASAGWPAGGSFDMAQTLKLLGLSALLLAIYHLVLQQFHSETACNGGATRIVRQRIRPALFGNADSGGSSSGGSSGSSSSSSSRSRDFSDGRDAPRHGRHPLAATWLRTRRLRARLPPWTPPPRHCTSHLAASR